MTANLSTQLRCDFPGCRTRQALLPGGHRWVRAIAKVQGWEYDPMEGDFCPEHAREASPNPRGRT